MTTLLRSTVLAVVLAGSAIATAAENVPEPVLTGIPHQALFSIAMDGERGIAVGAGGEIQVTEDGGATWTRETTPSPLSLLGAAVAGDRRVAVGQMGLVMVKRDSSEWSVVATGTEERLMDVSLNRNGLAVAVGSFGTVLRSVDHGQSWTPVSVDFETMFAEFAESLGLGFAPHLYGVKVTDDGRVVAVGELSTVLVSTDGGQQWRATYVGRAHGGQMDPSLFGLDLRADGVAFAVGQSGRVMRSEDGGEQWSVVPTDSTANFLGVGASTDDRVVVVGMREVIASRNGGKAWTRVPGQDIAVNWYSDTAHLDDGRRSLAVGHSGRIIAIDDVDTR